MKKILLATVVATSFAIPNAFAGDKVSGAYAGLDGGYAFVKGEAQVLADGLASSLGGSATSTQTTSAAVGRIFTGYNIDKHFAVELGYQKTADFTVTYSGVAGNRVRYSGNGNVSVSGIDYSLLIKPIETKGWDGLYAKVGGHYLDTSTDVSLTASGITGSNNTSTKGSGFLVGIGYEEPLSSTVDARVAYTYYNNVSGVSDSNANAITVGVLVKF